MPASLIKSAFHQAGEAMLIADAELKVLAANTAFAELSGVEPSWLKGRCVRELLDQSRLTTDPWEMLHSRDHVKAEFTYRNRMGRSAPAILSVSRLRDDRGQPSHHLVVLSDLAALAASGRKTGREVYFDALTGLPNRELLSQLLNESLEHAKRRGARVALGVLDVDHFKSINDRHGQDMGDSLIALLAQRISHLVHGDDILARIAGDEFALILQQGADEAVLSRLLDALAAPFFLRGEALQITVSLGVTFFPQDDADGDVLLRHATQAMHRAKQRGRNTFHVFDPRFDRELQAREAQRRRFRQAIEKDELRLYYQPQVDMFDGRVIGVEALVRWQHPEEGLLAPGHFLPLVEGVSLDTLLGEWVLEAALKQLSVWQSTGVTLPVHVNISPAHLLSGHFVQRLTGLLDRYPEVPATRLKLEVLESAAMGDLQAALATMRDCQTLGIDFAIDDFGTGYSSLTHLRQLPVDLIKIDQSFVRDMLSDPDDMAIVESVIFMANRFRRPMLAEGVESLEHARALLALGCVRAQGYGIARPMPAESLPTWLSDWPRRRDWTALGLAMDKPARSTRRGNVIKA
ncbi:PAS domain S-box-containing protein/diguanylate cyclase (GGDEF) domain-containing protein [Halomonas shengliensis]|uniref:PAS domain S-box-containing protein/diguanylate cyclase (GGDEF) domain-containing protein n=1 Tax=Halomonas shengliensis TaxID=419597 RepID=A0A1H0EXF8_9GAMM|nr:EAL domain-containing protein [Halomonas shengliensis]SDN86986.1 PAS domain S-box-containing protein/diguanylate cyclase (GGDEF) domain-containing protein [Halomonas shengliensis]